MFITEQLELEIQTAFGEDSLIIISALDAVKLLLISCTLTADKVFEIFSLTHKCDLVKKILSIKLASCREHIPSIDNDSAGKIQIKLYKHSLYTMPIFRFIRQFSKHNTLRPVTELYYLTEEIISEDQELPTLQEYLQNLSGKDLKTFIAAVNDLIINLPDCVFTGNTIAVDKEIVVTVAKSARLKAQWIIGVYDGSGEPEAIKYPSVWRSNVVGTAMNIFAIAALLIEDIERSMNTRIFLPFN